MFGHQERVVILLLIAVALVVIVAHVVLVQIGKAPFASAYSDQSADGALVSITGVIDQATVCQKRRACAVDRQKCYCIYPATLLVIAPLSREQMSLSLARSRPIRVKKKLWSVRPRISG